MSTFLGVMAVIAVVLFLVALLLWAILVWFVGSDAGWRFRTRLLHTVGCVVMIALVITWIIDAGLLTSDNSKHCGPGTHYVSESHYNVATKTTITEWMCVA